MIPILERFTVIAESKVSTLIQMTNFRLFQAEKVYRQQFQIQWKWQKGLQNRLKTLWEKGEIARYEKFLLFPQCFQKTITADT